MPVMKTNFDFSIALLSLLPEDANSVISPHGIATVLSMAAEGASKDSLAEILAVLGYRDLDELRTKILAIAKEPSKAFSSENTVAFAQYLNNDRVLVHFKQIMRDWYGALVLDEDTDSDLVIQLKNVANFKAEWLYKFERDSRRPKIFHNKDATSSFPFFLAYFDVPLRHFKKTCNTVTVTQAVALPYQFDGSDAPYELVLINSIEPLTAAHLREILSQMRERCCSVTFPEFTVEKEYDLIPLMKKLGLRSVFDAHAAPFDRMASIPIHANVFRQKAKIEVDQHGTIATAETEFGGVLSMRKYTRLIFDRPFVYLLRNTITGDILFIGKVNQLNDCLQNEDKMISMKLELLGEEREKLREEIEKL